MIDEAELEKTIIALRLQLQDIHNLQMEITNKLTALEQIRLQEKPTFDPDTGVKKTIRTEKPIDVLTGQPISDARREEIYNAVITKAKDTLRTGVNA